MEREEAITTLKEMHDSFDEIHENTNGDIGYEQMTAIDMAIEALQADVVSREEAIQAVDKCRERKNKEIEQLREFYSQNPTIPMFAESEDAYKEWTREEMGRPHGRLIDADKLEPLFYEHLDDRAMAGAMNAIDDAPTVEVRPHGEWIECLAYNPDLDADVPYIECDQCGHTPFYSGTDIPNYCPNCGADMRGEEE